MRVIEMRQEDYRKIMHENNGLIAAHAELQARFVELEDEVNVWLEQNPGIKVIDIKQSASGGSWVKPQFFLAILYEPSV